MKKVFISQPMRGFSEEEVLSVRKEAVEKIEAKLGEKVEVIENFIKENAPESAKIPNLWYLGSSIMSLSEADLCYFVSGWKNADGCVAEMVCCRLYGITTYVENYQKYEVETT